jgi:hypothetical protein
MRVRSTALVLALGGVALLAARASSGGAAAGTAYVRARPPSSAGPAPSARISSGPLEERVRSAALLATGSVAVANRAASCMREGTDPKQCLDDVAASQEAARAASEVLFPMLMTPGSYGFDEMVLNVVTKTPSGEPVYGLQGPCAASDAVPVHPWWELQSTVLVCPDSYAPDHVFDRKTHARCGSTEGRPDFSRDCGCGVNLLYCARNGSHANEMYASWTSEVRDTVASVVMADRPLKDIFTMNETVRNAIVETRYRRARIANGADAATVLAEPLWPGVRSAPRIEITPGQHAGILTTPQAIFRESGFRERIQLYSKMLWCIEPTSAQVATSAVFDLGTADFRHGKGWESLVARPICNGCHARIDYGLQFFSAYSWAPKAADYLLSERDLPKSYVYINGPDDLRGEADSTPLAFARIAVEQPEVGRCMTTRMVDRVLGDSATTADVAAVWRAYAHDGTYRALLRAALGARLAKTQAAPPAAPATASVGAESPATASGSDWEHAMVDVPASLRALIDDDCVTCHDEGDRDFRGAKLAVPRVLKMINRVASRSMPPGTTPLSTEERGAIIEELIATLPFDAPAKATLRDYHLGGDEAPAMRPDHVVRDTISWRAGPGAGLSGNITPPPPGLLSLGTDGETRLTPGEATAIGIAALKACERAGGDASCLERATASSGLTYDSE